jgi:YD repeat-containing protein
MSDAIQCRRLQSAPKQGQSLNHVTEYVSYDGSGCVKQMLDANSVVKDLDFVTYTYDAAHQLTGISDALNNSISYTLDNAAHCTKEDTKDPSNVIKLSLTFDADSNVDKTTDGLGRVADQNVDPLNRVMQPIQDQGTGKINATSKFTYDARDNLIQVTDPSGNTQYCYDRLGNLARKQVTNTPS